jgi:hypothetical protein
MTMTKPTWAVLAFIVAFSLAQTFCLTEWEQDSVIMEKVK